VWRWAEKKLIPPRDLEDTSANALAQPEIAHYQTHSFSFWTQYWQNPGLCRFVFFIGFLGLEFWPSKRRGTLLEEGVLLTAMRPALA
jgi:hypothetical protein